MAVTLKELAKELNVSVMTVSRVLNGRADAMVSENTKQRVMATAARMGYRPNPIARALVTGRTDTICLVVGEINDFQLAFLRPLQLLLAADGYNILTLNQGHYKYLNQHPRPDMLPVDGIIRIDAPKSMEWSSTAAGGVEIAPEVSIGTFTDPALDYVGIDIQPAMSGAVRHLATTGRKRIALVGGVGLEPAESPTHAYTEAFLSAVRCFDVDGQILSFEPEEGNHKELGRDVVPALLREHGMPDGVVFSDDELAIGAYRGLHECGVRVPEDVAIIGIDGITETEFLECQLSTMLTPFQEMCELAWNYLKKRMQDPSIPLQQTLVTPRLVLRESSEPRRGLASRIDVESTSAAHAQEVSNIGDIIHE